MSASSFTMAQQVALAVVPKITGFASMFFSSLIVYYVVRSPKKRRQTYHRLMAAISVCDLSASFWLALSTWPIPESSGLLWAVGNDTTCHLQGFFTQFGISSSFYNASLSFYYLLVIKYGWKEHNMRRLEPILHGIPLLWSLGTAIAGLIIGIFGNASLWCWIHHTANVYRWTFFYGPLWCMILIVTVNCILIYRHVQKLQRAVEKYRYNDPNNSTSGVGAQRFDAQRMRESSIEQHQQEQQQQQQQAIILNSRDVDAIADSLINEEEDDDDVDDHHHEGDAIGDDKKDDDSSNNDDDDDLEKNPTTTAVSVGSTTVPATTATTAGEHAVVANNSNSRSDGMQQQQQQRRSARVWTLARQRKNRQTREVAKQSFLYAGAFYINWLALTLTRILQTANGKVYFPLLLIAAMTTPMQGLPNFLVYLRPRFQRKLLQRQQQHHHHQQQHMATSAAAAARSSSSSRPQGSQSSSQLTRQSSQQRSSKLLCTAPSASSLPSTPNIPKKEPAIIDTPVTTTPLTSQQLPCPPLTDIHSPNDATTTTTSTIEMTTTSTVANNKNDDNSDNNAQNHDTFMAKD